MRNPGRTTLAMALLVAAAACGGSDDSDADVDSGAPPTVLPDDDADDTQSADDNDDGEIGDVATPDAPAGGDFEVPVAKYTAHGPEAANTIAPSCGMGNDDSGGDLFRFTPPADWTWTASSGGTGHDEVTVVDPDGVRVTFTEAVTPDELSLVTDWEVVGPSGVDLDIDGAAIPMMEVNLEGTTGYAIVDLEYLAPLPIIDAALGTAAVWSDTEGRPTMEEAQTILGSTRVERCAAMSQAMIWSAAGGFAPVPLFDPDPMGKTRPDQPQPAVVGLPGVEAYTVEQVAYLMPVEEARSICAAEAAIDAYADQPGNAFTVFTPSGTHQDDLAAVIADC